MKLIDLLGAIGLVGILLAYFLLQTRKLDDDAHTYNLLNIVGSLSTAIYSYHYRAYFSVILNVIWGDSIVGPGKKHKK